MPLGPRVAGPRGDLRAPKASLRPPAALQAPLIFSFSHERGHLACDTSIPVLCSADFSTSEQGGKERNVLLVDLEPLPDELLPDDIRGDSNGGGDADTTPAAEQARRPHESNTRALSAV